MLDGAENVATRAIFAEIQKSTLAYCFADYRITKTKNSEAFYRQSPSICLKAAMSFPVLGINNGCCLRLDDIRED
jgi:hypothetical protein